MSVVTVTILSNGKAIDESIEVESVAVTKAVNRVPSAEIRLLDGDPASGEYPVSDGTTFKPGTTVEIKLRYEGETDHRVFTGPVVRQTIESNHRGSILTVQAKDSAVALTSVRRSKIFADKTDADVVGEIVSKAGLGKGKIPTTKAKHAHLVQYRATDWDFIVSRADVNGLLVVAEGGKITLAPIDIKGSPAHKFAFGIDQIFDVEVELDGASQHKGVVSTCWDPAKQKMTPTSKAAANPSFATGDRDGSKIAGAIGVKDPYTLSQAAAVDADELTGWASATLARNRMALVRGRISLEGKGDVALLDVIELTGVGERFSGNALVTGVSHRVSRGGWTTDVQFGLPASGFCEEPNIAEPGAAGLLPPVAGLQVGVVADFKEDPSDEGRVQVMLPGVEPDGSVVWARLSAPDAGKARGWFFRPEPGDEVVIGFLNDDPRQPIVIGSLFSSKQPPDDDMVVDKDNFLKGIVTRSGARLIFTDEEKAKILVETPSGNGVLLDDDEEAITITDQHGNTVTMSKDGVEVKSAKDLVLNAAGDVKVKADGNVEIKGTKVDVK